jgi:hypothetical protein
MVVFDEIAEQTGDDQWDEWKRQVLDASDEIASFVARCRSGGDAEVIDWFEGSFNFCLRVTFNKGDSDAIIRFPGPGHTTFEMKRSPTRFRSSHSSLSGPPYLSRAC